MRDFNKLPPFGALIIRMSAVPPVALRALRHQGDMVPLLPGCHAVRIFLPDHGQAHIAEEDAERRFLGIDEGQNGRTGRVRITGDDALAAFGIARAISQKNTMQDGGSAVFMSSVAGSTGQVGMTAYSAAKAGIDGLVRSLSCELAARAIRVNAIAAGAVETAMHARLTKGSGEGATAEYARSHLLGFGAAEDVANAAVFLLSGASRWVTGSVMAVDGGYMVR